VDPIGIFDNVGQVQEGMRTIARPRALVDRADARTLSVSRGSIRFENVRFHYGKNGGVIDNLSFSIAPGEKVGVVGRSGAGKSMLVNLLLRFYDVEGGRILIDGQDIARMTQDSLRQQIGMVTQDTSLLHRSIAENIRYGRLDATEETMVAAARQAHAHEFVMGLTDADGRKGYETLVGERGVKLSGGQRQRIAIARVLLKNAPILVLDEATSSLDSEVEAAIQENFQTLMEGKTVIAIAHRLSTIAAMDRLIVLKDGQICGDRHASGASGARRDLCSALAPPVRRVPRRRRGVGVGSARSDCDRAPHGLRGDGTMRAVSRCALAAVLALTLQARALRASAASDESVDSTAPGVGAQYDGTHVYVAPADMAPFVESFTATFGGQSAKPVTTMVTPTPSTTSFAAVRTPAGPLSVFAFTTPIPYPFGAERTGYLVKDMDAAIGAAIAAGADVLVAPFPDPIGRDVVIQWPGGVNMQLYWHAVKPSAAPLATIPENRVYLSPAKADAFIADFVGFSKGRIASDDSSAPGVEIGRPGEAYRRVRIESAFGKLTVLATDGHLPFPYGREVTGYEVEDLTRTLDKAKAAGVTVLVSPYQVDDRDAAIVQFPGGYIAEIHAIER
jgi:ABC-type multidrug transport system ATPase subunit